MATKPRGQGVDVTGTDLRVLFPWLTRARMGRRFGSVPIGWYQQHQCAALNYIANIARANRCDPTRVRVRNGHVFAARGKDWVRILDCSTVFRAADRGGS